MYGILDIDLLYPKHDILFIDPSNV